MRSSDGYNAEQGKILYSDGEVQSSLLSPTGSYHGQANASERLGTVWHSPIGELPQPPEFEGYTQPQLGTNVFMSVATVDRNANTLTWWLCNAEGEVVQLGQPMGRDNQLSPLQTGTEGTFNASGIMPLSASRNFVQGPSQTFEVSLGSLYANKPMLISDSATANWSAGPDSVGSGSMRVPWTSEINHALTDGNLFSLNSSRLQAIDNNTGALPAPSGFIQGICYDVINYAFIIAGNVNSATPGGTGASATLTSNGSANVTGFFPLINANSYVSADSRENTVEVTIFSEYGSIGPSLYQFKDPPDVQNPVEPIDGSQPDYGETYNQASLAGAGNFDYPIAQPFVRLLYSPYVIDHYVYDFSLNFRAHYRAVYSMPNVCVLEQTLDADGNELARNTFGTEGTPIGDKPGFINGLTNWRANALRSRYLRSIPFGGVTLIGDIDFIDINDYIGGIAVAEISFFLQYDPPEGLLSDPADSFVTNWSANATPDGSQVQLLGKQWPVLNPTNEAELFGDFFVYDSQGNTIGQITFNRPDALVGEIYFQRIVAPFRLSPYGLALGFAY